MCTDAYREALTRDPSSRAPSTPELSPGDQPASAAATQAQPVVAKGRAQALIAATTDGARTGSLSCVPGMCSR
jgi:hypothetical protein